ncbi:MAG TPA: hypothetical protein VE197_17280, partial [Mycobacterium sp.]|nr:hypothetical protein [Mycobacterium sp.]
MVLTAVLQLLCDWSRISDDAVRLAQVKALAATATGRRYDDKTIGRALAALAAGELITYLAARGRGKRAVIAIHPRFTADIHVLQRDAAGHVIATPDADSVTFSRPPYKEITTTKEKTYPPTPRERHEPPNTRPTEVDVSPKDVVTALTQLPTSMVELPPRLRWLLGGQIRDRLRAGWHPDQILEVLNAPMPSDLQRPWRLALWRLRHNMPGAGPRLAPLQQAWDRQETARAQSQADEATARWYGKVAAVTTEADRARLLQAHSVKFG